MQRPPLALTLVLVVTAFLVTTSFTTAQARQQVDQPRKVELVKLIEDRTSLVDDLDAAVGQLRDELSSAQRLASGRDLATREVTAELKALALQAGTAAVTGRGVVVDIDNSDRTPANAADVGAYRIHDTDLQLLVNALFLSGAEAVSINSSRVVATTAIRAAGDTIVVNFRPVSPPFRIAAIGADRDRFDSTEIAARFRRWAKVFGLGYRVGVEDDLRAPAYAGRVRITAAIPEAGS